MACEPTRIDRIMKGVAGLRVRWRGAAAATISGDGSWDMGFRRRGFGMREVQKEGVMMRGRVR